jgi:CheY-like chemotaxis protein
LIAEDNRQARESLIRSLAGFGIEPDVACNGMEARELARQAEYDLILLDSLMPEMDGATAARLIRQDAALTGKKRATILALSAQTNETSLRECLEAGMDGSVAKPSEGGTLHGTMQSAFRGDLHDALHATLERWLAEASPAGAGSEHI